MLVVWTSNAQRLTSITVSGTTYQLTDDLMDSPRAYAAEFFDECRRRGVDISHIRSVNIDLADISWAGVVWSGYCSSNVRIQISREYQRTASLRDKRHNIYHELGHAILDKRHVCYLTGETEVPFWTTVETVFYMKDIMWSSRLCIPQITIGEQVLQRQRQEIPWDTAVNRLFDSSIGNVADCRRTGSKGSFDDALPITCNPIN